MAHERCPEIIAHAEILGELRSDVKYIKQKIDNGLSDKMTNMEASLENAKKVIDDRISKIDAENWFNRILTGSAKKIIALIIFMAFLSGLTSTVMWANYKYYGFKEVPGQQQATYEMQISNAYHKHILQDGRIVFHADDPTQSAGIFNPITKTWENYPQMRVDAQLPKR
jgi:hypothetical protein